MALDFRNFDKRLIVILKEEKRIKEAYERWIKFQVGRFSGRITDLIN